MKAYHALAYCLLSIISLMSLWIVYVKLSVLLRWGNDLCKKFNIISVSVFFPHRDSYIIPLPIGHNNHDQQHEKPRCRTPTPFLNNITIINLLNSIFTWGGKNRDFPEFLWWDISKKISSFHRGTSSLASEIDDFNVDIECRHSTIGFELFDITIFTLIKGPFLTWIKVDSGKLFQS